MHAVCAMWTGSLGGQHVGSIVHAAKGRSQGSGASEEVSEWNGSVPVPACLPVCIPTIHASNINIHH